MRIQKPLAFIILAAFVGATAVLIPACSDDTQNVLPDGGAPDASINKAITCGTGASGSLSAGSTVEVTGQAAKDLAGASVTAPKSSTLGTVIPVTVNISCAADIAPAGYLTMGPAVSFTPDGNTQPVDLKFTLPYKPSRLPAKANLGSLVVVMKRKGKISLLPLLNPQTDSAKGRLSFNLDELATFQLAISDKAGTMVKRQYVYRAIVGFSMGGGASAAIGLRNPDKFDFIGPLGGEPAGHLDYFLNWLNEGFLTGFCTAADQKAGKGNIGQICPLRRQPMSDQHELLMSFEKMLYQPGQGVGLTLRRDLYMKGIRDILRAYGNAIYYNPDSPYLPPGVPDSYLASGSSVCGNPIKMKKFYDREYNPDGSKTVITFCDSNDSSALGLGVFDPSLAQTKPVQILVAVDLNDNGKRDSGEPVVVHVREPFVDVGVDGKADSAETGYDAQKNPDPAGDNYHYLKNPSGTENNWRWDKGEPYEDVGIDGVKGTCQAKSGTAECYDYGEGNSKYDLSPMGGRWREHDPFTMYSQLTEAQRARLDIWADAGIRDFLNAHIATNGLMGQVANVGEPIRIYEAFTNLLKDPTEIFFNFGKVNWSTVGKNVYVRYGDPSMSQAQVEKTGDGRHVGTALQIVNRTLSFFAYVQNRWPDGDRVTKDIDISASNFLKGQTFKSPSTGQDRPYALFVPPGYFQKQNQSRTYPVVYFFHGYGQKPDELMDLSGLFANYMVSPTIADDVRFQKFIIVYVDGRCRPGGTIPVPQIGDQCEQGNFYLDSPIKSSTAKMETLLMELMAHIDKNYRTKKAAEVSVPYY